MNPNPKKSPNAENEERILAFWRDHNVFQKSVQKDAPMGEYNFFEGPPTANGRPGIHHVGARSFKDIIPRYKTMRGFRVNRKSGWDTHGLPVELQVEKQIGSKSKKDIEAYGVAAFNRLCRESVWTYKEEWERLTERMGYWIDMKDPYVTYENRYIEALWATVKKLDGRGHLYRDFKVLPWCTRCGTALSSHELNQPGAYREVKDLSVFVKFPLVDFKGAYFLAWTTTPWTLPGNVALAVGADIDYVEAKVGDEVLVLAKDLVGTLPEGYEILAEHKGSEMAGMAYEPLFPYLKDNVPADQADRLANAFKIYAADFVTTTDGTGIVHIAPMYGADDFDVATKNNLPKFHTVNEEGRFVAGTDFLAGRYAKEADENGKPTLAVDIISYLKGKNLFFKQENVKHPYPHCWRCDTPLLYYARTSWYFDVSKIRDQLVAANEAINWEPDHIKEGRFGEWLDGVKDWAISRDRYWGTPIPVWETASGKRVVIGGVSDIRQYAKKSGNRYFVMRHGESEKNLLRLCTSDPDATYHLTDAGRDAAARAARELADKGITKIVASPFVRTRETARIASEILGIAEKDILYDAAAGEFDYGDFEGYTKEQYHAWHDEHEGSFDLDTRVPGGESLRAARERIARFMYGLDERYRGETILVVTHGIFLECMPSIVAGWDVEETFRRWREDPVPTGSWREFDFVPLPHDERYELDFHKPFIDQIKLELDGERLVRTPEVMDVWFDSGTMPIAQNHVLGGPVDFDPRPADYIAEGVDQTRGWFYLMHAVANLLHDEPTVAYRNVVCMGLLMDEKGMKMSKSKGNIVDPWAMFDTYGADVVRFWFYSVNQPGESKNFDEKSLDEVNKKVFNLLRNVVSFYETYRGDESPDDDAYHPYDGAGNVLDTWILAKLDELSIVATRGLDAYQVLEPARAIREFVGELSQWYLRRSRERFKGADEADRKRALRTTRLVLRNLSVTMAPFTPFVAEEVFRKVRFASDPESVHLTGWIDRAVAGVDWGSVLSDMEGVRTLVTLGLEARARANIKVRQPLARITVGESGLGEAYLNILKDELNVKEVVTDPARSEGGVVLDTEVIPELRDEGEMRDLVRLVQDMRKEAGLVPADRVIVSLPDQEPGWFATYRAEVLESVGAEGFRWGSAEASVEKA